MADFAIGTSFFHKNMQILTRSNPEVIFPFVSFGHFSDLSNRTKITLIINLQMAPGWDQISFCSPLFIFIPMSLPACLPVRLSIINVACAWSCRVFPQGDQSEWHVSLVLGITHHKPSVVMCIPDKQDMVHCHIYQAIWFQVSDQWPFHLHKAMKTVA